MRAVTLARWIWPISNKLYGANLEPLWTSHELGDAMSMKKTFVVLHENASLAYLKLMNLRYTPSHHRPLYAVMDSSHKFYSPYCSGTTLGLMRSHISSSPNQSEKSPRFEGSTQSFSNSMWPCRPLKLLLLSLLCHSLSMVEHRPSSVMATGFVGPLRQDSGFFCHFA